MRALIRAIWDSSTVWRYADAYAPRVFGLVIHTLLVWRYGMAAYALATWCLGVLGITLGLIPDPHAYIVVRSTGGAARRLLALTTPWIVLKVLLASMICGVIVLFCASPSLFEPHRGRAAVVIAGALLYGAVEAAWGVLGTVAMAIGNLRRVAITAIGVRTLGLAALMMFAAAHVATLWLDLVLISAPTGVALVLMMPMSRRWSRNAKFMWFASKGYGIWSQGLALLSSLQLQAPVLVLGAWPIATVAAVGQISYITRVIASALQPVQILQSLLIRETALAGGRMNEKLRRLRTGVRASAVLIGATGVAGLLALRAKAALEPGVAFVAAGLVGGITFSSWFRFEVSSVLASTNIRQLLLLGFVPVLAASAALGAVLVYTSGMVGLGVIVALTWAATGLSYRWTQQSQ